MAADSLSVWRYSVQLPAPFTADWVGNIHLYQEGDEAILLVPNNHSLMLIHWTFSERSLSENYTRIAPHVSNRKGLFFAKSYDRTSTVCCVRLAVISGLLPLANDIIMTNVPYSSQLVHGGQFFLYSATWPSYLMDLLSLGHFGAVGAKVNVRNSFPQ